MTDRVISLSSDSGGSSDIDLHRPGTSSQYDFTPKTCNSQNLKHSLSDSDLSEDEENIQNKKAGNGATKKIKTTLVQPNTGKTNQNKKDTSLKQQKDKLKCIKPKESLKYLSIVMPESLFVDDMFKDVLRTLVAHRFQFEIISTDLSAISWIWKGILSEFSKTSHMAVIWHLDKCVSMVQKRSLIDYFTELMKKKPNQRIYLILYGTQKDLRDQKIREEVDYALCELELTTGITHTKLYNPHDIANFLLHLSKSVSQELYRAELEKLEQEKTFYLEGRSQNCVKVDKENNGMKKLWVQQIAVIHRLPLDSAKVICGHHPTPYSLYETYENLSNIKEKQALLQDILVGRGSGAKRLGPKMSGKIALLFANNNGDLHLSDWQ